MKPQISLDQNRKKTEKDPPLLPEAAPKERLRGKIEGRFKAPLMYVAYYTIHVHVHAVAYFEHFLMD